MAAGPALFCCRDAARQGMEACLLLCKQDLLVDLGRNEKATWEKCPRLRAEVGLARGVGQSEGPIFWPWDVPCVRWRLLLGRWGWVWVDAMREGNMRECVVVPTELHVAF